MKLRHLAFALANFSAILVLAALIASPFYFAGSFTKVKDPERSRRVENVVDTERSRSVAGAKTIAPRQLTFQAENFPNLAFSQNGGKYQVSFTKIGPIQAYLGIGTLTNQTNTKHTYELQTQSQTKVFFGQNLEEQKGQISLGPGASIALSMFSPQEASESSQTVEFRIGVK